MCGGGGSPPPAARDPLEEARAQILIEQERASIQAQQRAAELEREAVQAETDRTSFDRNLDQAFEGALTSGSANIEERGLVLEDFLPQLTTALESTRRSVPFLDPNPGSFFGDDIADIVLNRAQDTQRRGFRNDLNEFAAPGFAQTLFPGTADDAILQSILNEQFEPASDSILRAFQRGNLTDQGFRTASDQLGSQRDVGLARLQDIGGGVLGGFRGELRDIAETGFNRANTFELGETFDPSSTQGLIDTRFADQSTNLGGAIRGALGSEQLFNIEDLITRGGISQGAQNPTGGLFDAFATRNKEREKRRGLGSEGVF